LGFQRFSAFKYSFTPSERLDAALLKFPVLVSSDAPTAVPATIKAMTNERSGFIMMERLAGQHNPPNARAQCDFLLGRAVRTFFHREVA